VRSTFWLHLIRVLLGVMLFFDVVTLVLSIFFTQLQTVGTVKAGDIFAGEPYLHRMHQELGVRDVFVYPSAGVTTAQRVLYLTSQGLAFCLALIPMLILARRLITGVITQDPFTLRTVHRLRALAAVVLIGGAASELTAYISARILLDSVVHGNLRTWASPDVHPSL
jgi:hypothetical protein